MANGPEMERPAGLGSGVMTLNESLSLERILESAIVVSWADVMRGTQAGSIHIEYGFAANGTLDGLQVLSSRARGYWVLACEYWMSASRVHCAGVHFENGYRSENLAHVLDSVMQHQTAFVLPANLGRQGLLQISAPTEEDRVGATASVKEALCHVGSLLDQGVMAEAFG